MSGSQEKRDWLVLSLKWSKDYWLVWYATACCGYTQSLVHAGRYTEAEARSLEVPDQAIAVSLTAAVWRLGAQVGLRNDKRLIRRLKRLSRKAATT